MRPLPIWIIWNTRNKYSYFNYISMDKPGTKPGTGYGTARRLLQPDICERWKWSDPQEIADRLLRETSRLERRGEAISLRVPAHATRDRYYTQAKRLHVKQLLKGKT